ncbi:MAG: cbb3-type cytochrome c oxidase N-terminal domain-containing protein [Myxococcota bacterium]
MQPQQKDEWFEHEYDGIRELNNPMPTWWTSIFWGTFFFSIAYIGYYHFGPGTLVMAEYNADVAEATAKATALAMKEGPVTEDSLAALMRDPAVVKEGNLKFVTYCAPCHGEHAEGKIGPNLTDSAWINGDGSLKFIHTSVENGYPARGMVPWGKILKPDELKRVVAFVGSVRNTNVPGKPPEGPRPAGTATSAAAAPAPAVENPADAVR